MGRKPSKNPKSRSWKFRTDGKEGNRLEWLINTYAGGNASLWLRYSALNATRKFLVRKRKK